MLKVDISKTINLLVRIRNLNNIDSNQYFGKMKIRGLIPPYFDRRINIDVRCKMNAMLR